MANTPITNISKKSQEGLRDYVKSCLLATNSSWNMRSRMRQIDQVYARERDYTEEQLRAETANRAGDPTKFQNVVVPVVLPAVESAVTYQSSVFLTGIPLFGVSATAGKMDAALQLETILDNHATKGGWIRELQLFFRDGFKYNLAGVEVSWERQKVATPETNSVGDATKLTDVIWEGNKLKRLDMYNTFFDPRVLPAEIAKRGEFAGYTELVSRVEMIHWLQSLTFRLNYEEALNSSFAAPGFTETSPYYIPIVNNRALLDPQNSLGFNWFAWAGLESKQKTINFQSAYVRTTIYARIIPRDLSLPSAEAAKPQIWKFVYVNNEVLVYAERQTNAHNLIPILFAQPLEDGLGYQTKSLAQNSQPFQDVASALVNSSIQARRRAVADRGLYNPQYVDAKAINNDNAAAKIPLRPAAYGVPNALEAAYKPIPFRDEQSAQAMSDVGAILRFNEMVTGQNAAQQGQFVKGNKTLAEYQDIMGNANGRSQNTSILLEAQFFTPLKELLKLNILQYQKPDEIYNRETEQVVQIDPVLLRRAALSFKVSDGLTPAAKQMNTDAFQAACQTLAAVPQLAQAYNIGPMFSYLWKMQRADVAQFEKSSEQLAYEQAMAQWQQAVQMLTEALSKQKDVVYTPEEMQKLLPPQPTPEQFNYVPGTPKQLPQGTVLQQLSPPQQP